MKAAVLESPGAISLRRMSPPDCPAGGLLVKVTACAVCSTDTRMFNSGHRDLIYPRVLGHEIAGVIVQNQNERFEIGDRVQLYPGIGCGKCESCQRGDSRRCKSLKILGFSADGGFAEYLSIPESLVDSGGVNRIPEFLTDEEAALTEPLASCLNAQENISVGCGDTVLIIGAGPLGLLHARLARHRGADKVIIVDKLKHRVGLALAFGKDDLVVNTDCEDLPQSSRAENGGRDFDVIIMATGQLSVGQLLPLLADEGRLSLFSGLKEEPGLSVSDINQLHYRELILSGVYGSTPEHNTEALNLIADGFSVRDMITRRFDLEQITEG